MDGTGNPGEGHDKTVGDCEGTWKGTGEGMGVIRRRRNRTGKNGEWLGGLRVTENGLGWLDGSESDWTILSVTEWEWVWLNGTENDRKGVEGAERSKSGLKIPRSGMEKAGGGMKMNGNTRKCGQQLKRIRDGATEENTKRLTRHEWLTKTKRREIIGSLVIKE